MIIFPVLFVSLLIFSCAGVEKAELLKMSGMEKISDEFFTIWALSDIQPREKAEYSYFEKSIDDINDNIRNVNIALVGGDIIHWSRSERYFKWYVETKNKSYIKYWYEIAGNHDHKDYDNYRKYIKMPLHYSVSTGNILILMLSDESKSAETNISGSAFEWWQKLVTENQDKIIITFTHAYLAQSGLFGAFVPSRNIRDSARFADVLRRYRVDIWLAGHAHSPHWINTTVKVKNSLGGTLFINVSAIRGNMFKNPESYILFFKNGSDHVLIRSRDHEEREFDENLDIDFTLSRAFQLDGAAPVMKAME